MNKPLLLLISAGCLVSCHKEASNPANNWTWFGTQNSTVYNYVLINANQVLTNSDSEELHIGVSAAFIDSNNHQVTVGPDIIGQQPDHSTWSGFTYSYNYNFTSGEIDKGSQIFGTEVFVTIHGIDEADTVTSSIYVPKQLSGTIESYPNALSVSKGLQLQWTPDTENTWGNVLIQLYYFSSLSRKSDSTLPINISTR